MACTVSRSVISHQVVFGRFVLDLDIGQQGKDEVIVLTDIGRSLSPLPVQPTESVRTRYSSMLMIWAEAAVPHNVRNRNRKVGFLSMQLKYSKEKKAAISTGLVILCLGYPATVII